MCDEITYPTVEAIPLPSFRVEEAYLTASLQESEGRGAHDVSERAPLTERGSQGWLLAHHGKGEVGMTDADNTVMWSEARWFDVDAPSIAAGGRDDGKRIALRMSPGARLLVTIGMY